MKKILFDDIIGMEKAKEILLSRLREQYHHKDELRNLGFSLAKGILLYGYPGTGKTMLINAAINELLLGNPNIEYRVLSLSDVANHLVGGTDRKVRQLFSLLRENPTKDTVLIMDEIDSIIPNRSRLTSVLTLERVNVLLQEIDGLDSTDNIFIIAATNRPMDMDKAVFRSGRIDYQILIDLPNLEQRKLLIKKYLGRVPLENIEEHLDTLAIYTKNWTGSDYNSLSTEIMTKSLVAREKGKNHILPYELLVEEICKHTSKVNVKQLSMDYSQFREESTTPYE